MSISTGDKIAFDNENIGAEILNMYKSIVVIDEMSASDILQTYSDSTIIFLDGYRMMTFEECYTELAKKLDFPKYFGRNINALCDMLTDLSWIASENLTLVVEKSYLLLVKGSIDDREFLLSLLEDVSKDWSIPMSLGETWSRTAVVFRTVLVE